MENKIYIDKSKVKYKGNLHTHSTRSDGAYSPVEVALAYKNKGYDFICLSDHEIYYKSEELDADDFILIDGYEMACDVFKDEVGSFHIHGLLDKSIESNNEFEHNEEHKKPVYENLDTVQKMIDEMIERGNLIIFNHPEWSENKFEDLLNLKGYCAIEIYNHQSDIEEACGNSVHYWDYLLRNNIKVFGVATDDAHGGDYSNKHSEFFGGWIGVEANTLKQQDIIDAIRIGNFYASNGPEIYDLRVEDGSIKVECSDSRIIKFVTFPQSGATEYDKNGKLINSANYKLRGNELYVRIECIDKNGRIAWSNPIFINHM